MYAMAQMYEIKEQKNIFWELMYVDKERVGILGGGLKMEKHKGEDHLKVL